jgi:DNA-binding transcriptional LysR family regulator
MQRLPPFDSLYVFAVAARHLSFTTAATELHRTQSAVSHRIKTLETELGVPLFTRLTRRLELTSAGRALAQRLDQAITDITRTIAEFDETVEARRLRVTMLPSVASRWLMPRLPRFFDLHPDIEVQVIADQQLLDLRAEGIDLAIRFGRGRYPGYTATVLMRDRVLPVCSPKFAAEHDRITTIDALLRLPLLHDSGTEGDGSLSDWRSWLNQLGIRMRLVGPGSASITPRFSSTLPLLASVLRWDASVWSQTIWAAVSWSVLCPWQRRPHSPTTWSRCPKSRHYRRSSASAIGCAQKQLQLCRRHPCYRPAPAVEPDSRGMVHETSVPGGITVRPCLRAPLQAQPRSAARPAIRPRRPSTRV